MTRATARRGCGGGCVGEVILISCIRTAAAEKMADDARAAKRAKMAVRQVHGTNAPPARAQRVEGKFFVVTGGTQVTNHGCVHWNRGHTELTTICKCTYVLR